MTEDERQELRREVLREAYDAIERHRFACTYYQAGRGRSVPLLGPLDFKNEVYRVLRGLETSGTLLKD